MTTGGDLFGWAPPEPDSTKFERFDAAHPQIWKLFEEVALRAVRERRSRSSLDVLHRLRWDHDIVISNQWCAFYARKFLRAHPEYAGLFGTRSRASAV